MTIADNTHPVRHRLRALIVEDDPTDAELIVSELQKNGFEVFWERVETEEQYLARLAGIPEIVLADYSLPQFNGSRALELLQQQGLAIPFVVVSGTVGCATQLRISICAAHRSGEQTFYWPSGLSLAGERTMRFHVASGPSASEHERFVLWK